MTGTEAIILGMIQGITEFLPVSSSGHLAFARIFIGFNEPSMAYDLLLHLSTMIATLIYFRRDLAQLIFEWLYGFVNKSARRWAGWRFCWAVIIGTLITAPIGFYLKPFAEDAFNNSLWLGGGFIVTGILLLTSRLIPERYGQVAPGHGALVGFVQGLAVMPGVSRSGSTIWAGLLFGLKREEAFRFSFLLSIPAILGATLLEARELGGAASFYEALPNGWQWGAGAAFIFGYLSLCLLKRLVINDRWWIFGVYTLLLGTTAVGITLLGGW